MKVLRDNLSGKIARVQSTIFASRKHALFKSITEIHNKRSKILRTLITGIIDRNFRVHISRLSLKIQQDGALMRTNYAIFFIEQRLRIKGSQRITQRIMQKKFANFHREERTFLSQYRENNRIRRIQRTIINIPLINPKYSNNDFLPFLSNFKISSRNKLLAFSIFYPSTNTRE